ncbi:IS66 Orf2 like protein [Clostridium cochlearium]|uniref:IS66 Orf2 like protein n=1 Tax=Clostridium cochlearium TaxID=1494 RepID=A0ABY0QQ82_CLOCO|nr:IS66 family insertion sequence element accessory protein TnpB [Clostridium cochlearium]SDL46986.1 IS66 Orf2 like protein [Clostridium cochlearium]
MLNQSRIAQVYLALGATDLRKSIDGLAVLVQESFNLDPFSRSLFVFCNRKKDKIKILEWDINGFWLYYKRLEKGTFKWPNDSNSKTILISDREFRWLLDGLSIEQKDALKEVKERIII